MNMRWQSYFWVWLAWTTIGLVHGLSQYTDIIKYNVNRPFTPMDVMYYVFSYWLWIIVSVTHLRFLSSMAYPFNPAKIAALFFITLVIWLPSYFSMDFAVATLRTGGSFADWQKRFDTVSGSMAFFYVVVYTLAFVACLGSVLAEKSRQARRQSAELRQKQTEIALQLSEQKMLLMQSQLSPHFLFNCLGAISGLARNGQRDTLIEAIATVGNLLRFTVTNSSVKTITLDEEITFAQDYITLQKLRFDNRFSCAFSLDIQDNHLFCPPFTLQPLLENVFRHAIENSEQHIDISVDVTQKPDYVAFRVCNSVIASAPQNGGSGTGLDNLKTRLAHLYADDFTLDITKGEEQFCVLITIPDSVLSHDL